MHDYEFTISVEAQEMRVSYRPDWMAGYDHIQFFSPHEPARRIPVSETGYRSHFSPPGEVALFPTIEEYAHELALALMRQKRPSDEGEDEAQGSLF
jgi:hypothetical protein